MQLAVAAGVVELRRRGRALIVLGLLMAAWAVAVLAAAEGARRTASALGRFQRSIAASDATFWIEGDHSGTDLRAAVRARPEVRASDSLWMASSGIAEDKGVLITMVASTDGVWGRQLDRPMVIEGRLADPRAPTEAMITTRAARLLDVGPGDRLSLPTWDRTDWERWVQERGARPAFRGPRVDVTVVGIVRQALDLHATRDADLAVVLTPAFVSRWDGDIGINNRPMVVSLDGDLGTAQTIASELTRKLERPVSVSTVEDDYAAHLRHASAVSRTALWVFAVVVALSGGALLVLACARELGRSGDRLAPMVSLGATAGQYALVVSLPLVLVAAAAVAVASAGAAVTSWIFPIGSARLLEPVRSLRPDWTVLLIGPALIAVVVLLAVVIGARPRRPQHGHAVRLANRMAFVDRLGAAAVVGRCNATQRGMAYAAAAAAALVIGGLVAATWITSSLHHLADDPSRWGYTWSASPELGFEPGRYGAAVVATLRHPAVRSVGQLWTAPVFVDDVPVDLVWFVQTGGDELRPRVVSGRAPSADGELALGENVARRLGLGIGDHVQVRSLEVGPTAYRVVGIVVAPPLPGVVEPGSSVVTTEAGSLRVMPFGGVAVHVVIAYERAADVGAVEAQLTERPGWLFPASSHAQLPGPVAILIDVAGVVAWLAGFFLVAGLTSAALLAARRGHGRARDFAVLRALGFTPGDVRRSVLTEGLVVAVVGSVIGVPLGIVIGRVIWRQVTVDLELDEVMSSLVGTGLLTAVMVMVGLVAGWAIESRRAMAKRPAVCLREQ